MRESLGRDRPGNRGAAVRLALVLAAVFGVSACEGGTDDAAGDDQDVGSLGGKADGASGPDPEVYRLARLAAAAAHEELSGLSKILAVVDFSLPSSKKRLWVIDLDTEAVLFYAFVAHGKNSGDLCDTTSFSNREGSLQSSLGLYRCAETATGSSVGYYVALDGLDPGYNDNARDRQILLHGADYVTTGYRNGHGGCCGRSWGCFAADPAVSKKIANTLTGGGLLFAYYPDQGWLSSSRWLQNQPPTPWVGTVCDGTDGGCAFTAAGKTGFCHTYAMTGDLTGGYCSLPCEGSCPDRSGSAPTFCVSDGASGGQCVVKADARNHYCADLPGTQSTQADRFIGQSGAAPATATVCLEPR